MKSIIFNILLACTTGIIILCGIFATCLMIVTSLFHVPNYKKDTK
jgi:hypothetical protein